ncbi:MAG TPA: hypothetical protein GYA06_13645 [Chloroflexi bacterium]|nr:hypothetical protein [Chloroflexota bacterium]
MQPSTDSLTTPSLDEFKGEIQDEISRVREALSEITERVTQSKAEVYLVSQKENSVTGQLQLLETEGENWTPAEIRDAYLRALEAQQRRAVMHNQLEILEARQAALEDQLRILNRMEAFLQECGQLNGVGARKMGIETLEMVINAQELERQRLSRQMHDGPAQALSNFIVQAQIAARLFDIDPAKAKAELEELKNAAMVTFEKVRAYIAELRPMSLDDLGLIPTLKRYVDSFQEESGVKVHLITRGGEQRLKPYLEVLIFRAAQEYLTNTARRNKGLNFALEMKVNIVIEQDRVKVAMEDNGKGVEPADQHDPGALSVHLLQERIEMLGGRIDVQSTPDQGNLIYFEIPTEAAE